MLRIMLFILALFGLGIGVQSHAIPEPVRSVASAPFPTTIPTTAPTWTPWDAPSEYMEYNPKAGLTRYVICVKTSVVYGSPRSDTFVVETLVEGDYVYPREWGRGYGAGWAMIAPAQWIFGGDICVAEEE